MEGQEYSYKALDLCGYRQLQKMAKTMGLPSNVKKVYLIEMIIAKRYSSPAELNVIVNRVKLDRLKVSQSRWSTSSRKNKRAQASEVSSTSKHSPISPSITMTPKRPGYIIQYSPDTTQTVIKYQPLKSYGVKKARASDRILRSFNTKTPRPDYAMMDDLTIDVSSPYNKKSGSFNTVSGSFNATSGSFKTTSGSFNPKNSSFNSKLMRPTSSNTAMTSYNTKIAHDYAITNHASSESSYNTKIVKTNLNTKLLKPSCTIVQRRSSILDQNSTITSYNAKIMKPNLNTELTRPTISKVRPSYAIMNRNDLITKVVRGQNSMKIKAAVPRIQVRRQSSSLLVYNEEIMLPRPSTNTSSPIPAKRKRTVSGIYPIESQENNYYECVQTVDFRHTDGKITKINALIQKPRPSYPIITVQDVINRKIESQIFKTSNNNPTDHVTKAMKHKPIITTTEKVSSVTKENTHPKRRYLDLSTNCVEETRALREYIDLSKNFTKNVQRTRDFSTNCTNITSPMQILDLSSDYMSNTQPTRQDSDFSMYCTQNTQPIRQDFDFSMNCTQNTHTIRQDFDFSMNCTQNTQPIRQFNDFSTNCIENTQPTRHFSDFSTNCVENTQPTRQYKDFSINCIDNTQPIRQYKDFSINCIGNTQPVRQFLDSSSTPTYTNVTIKGMPEHGNISVYYHNKIRSEEIRHRLNEQNEVLPHINEVFSRFNEVQYRNLTQPLYIQVSQESERFPHYPIILDKQDSGSMLESLYNFRQHLIVNQPLLKIASTANTECVFSAKTVISAGVQPPPRYNIDPSYAQGDVYNSNIQTEGRIYDYMRGQYQRDFCCNEVLSPNSSIGTTNSQELGANTSIPEMVEDALELISQDGDYMERIGMDAAMHCIMFDCNWLGSQLVLEYHIRQVHQTDILKKENPEWSVVLTLGSLASHDIWLSHVIQYRQHLYVLSARYCDDCIMVALMTLTETSQNPKRGKITVYNKISGKPFVWEDEIPYIPETMPYNCTENCLKIGSADLDLLPNSANLKLINNELRTYGTKVVVGQPSLDNIDIVIYVSIFD